MNFLTKKYLTANLQAALIQLEPIMTAKCTLNGITNQKTNTMAKAGRPLKFTDPKELQKKIDAYFAHCDARTRKKYITTREGVEVVNEPWPIPYTVEGLAVYLDTNRETLINYSEKESFFDVIARAKEKIFANKVEGGLDKTYDPQMAKFMLKNNYKLKENADEDEQADKTVNININYPDKD